jgi:hypothetical protein
MSEERVAEVTVRLDLEGGTLAGFADELEVSLDCPVCCRCCRTVVFRGEAEGVCTPTGRPFPGRVVRKAATGEGVSYTVAYCYTPFEDAKYPARRPTGAPRWARVSFVVVCLGCGRASRQSTQSNIVRPWSCRCPSCGSVLYTEAEEMSRLSWRPAGCGT